MKFYQRIFKRGTLYNVSLFLDFEDWRIGSRGFKIATNLPPQIPFGGPVVISKQSNLYNLTVIRGAHFSPFEYYISTTTNIPSYLKERNIGLVLDRQSQTYQVNQQDALLLDLSGEINWMTQNLQTATMDFKLRSRKDVIEDMRDKRAKIYDWKMNEVNEMKSLNSSQCSYVNCVIRFNTSALTLTGAITGKGEYLYSFILLKFDLYTVYV